MGKDPVLLHKYVPMSVIWSNKITQDYALLSSSNGIDTGYYPTVYGILAAVFMLIRALRLTLLF